MSEGNANLFSVVFIRKRNGSAVILLTGRYKTQSQSSLSSELAEQFLLGFVVMVVLWKGGNFDWLLITCQPLVSPCKDH